MLVLACVVAPGTRWQGVAARWAPLRVSGRLFACRQSGTHACCIHGGPITDAAASTELCCAARRSTAVLPSQSPACHVLIDTSVACVQFYQRHTPLCRTQSPYPIRLVSNASHCGRTAARLTHRTLAAHVAAHAQQVAIFARRAVVTCMPAPASQAQHQLGIAVALASSRQRPAQATAGMVRACSTQQAAHM
jgi:hypothetical protein